MDNALSEWSSSPLFHASTNVINTSTQTGSTSSCAGGGFVPRLNVGNIHEIKRFWQLPNVSQDKQHN
ncbi:hypothetical protein [Pseudomonas sp. Ant30-3]|uniref:hypothetical protein n=1 Tax=Pseudomonas sp. Ant30-3 TaxID=1488328 RepID=UPI0009DCE584|nr:hypothetical protein [Pseudomonas sp. Ant30-3]